MGPAGFDVFDLHPALSRGLHAAGFESPRPIQEQTLPAGLEGRDVLGLAQTGTGKTAAFALPLLERILEVRGRGPRALVLAPTRELATQIADEIRTLARFTRIRVVTVFGVTSVRAQINALRKRPEIVVGCPGRVLDLMGQDALPLGRIETLVLDEADHMFDMGFLPDIRRILEALPERRQNLLFSATMPPEIRGLAQAVLHEPEVVEMATSQPARTIDHYLHPLMEDRKRKLVEALLSGDDCTSPIVFTRTKHRARRLAEQLARKGHQAVALQNNMSQAQRDRAMKGFCSGTHDVLVATDIAARGIDVSGVSHVINFDVPTTPEAYTHRIGRTGRSEREGVAITFVTGEDRAWVRATERMLGDPIPRRSVEGFDDVSFEEPKRPGPTGRKRRTSRSRKGDGGEPKRHKRPSPNASRRGRGRARRRRTS